MEYNKIKNADKIIAESKFFVKDPYKYKNKWHDLFGNKNPISLELGMGRGDFIINMAKKYPNVNFIGLELYPSQMVMDTEKLKSEIRIDLLNKGYLLPAKLLPMNEVVNYLKININYLQKMAKENLN